VKGVAIWQWKEQPVLCNCQLKRLPASHLRHILSFVTCHKETTTLTRTTRRLVAPSVVRVLSAVSHPRQLLSAHIMGVLEPFSVAHPVARVSCLVRLASPATSANSRPLQRFDLYLVGHVSLKPAFLNAPWPGSPSEDHAPPARTSRPFARPEPSTNNIPTAIPSFGSSAPPHPQYHPKSHGIGRWPTPTPLLQTPNSPPTSHSDILPPANSTSPVTLDHQDRLLNPSSSTTSKYASIRPTSHLHTTTSIRGLRHRRRQPTQIPDSQTRCYRPSPTHSSDQRRGGSHVLWPLRKVRLSFFMFFHQPR
jgi:hypothetical protein